jgi:hypothetical protein
MLQQGIGQWAPTAIHDTVAVLLRSPQYRRSFWGSIFGRGLTELFRFFGWLFDSAQRIPGGRATVITVVSLVVLLILARLFLAAEWDNAMPRARGRSLRPVRIDPWSEAEALAAAGDYMGAAHSLYQGVLRRLAQSERLRLHPSKTTGDYARELRRRGAPQVESFRAFGRRFDRVVFGAGVCTRDDFQSMLADAMAIPDRQAAA